MTREEISTLEQKLRLAYDAANKAESDYRVAKAEMFIRLSTPTDGSKKPAEAFILSTIDSDKRLVELRNASSRASAELDVQKMVFKALVRADA